MNKNLAYEIAKGLNTGKERPLHCFQVWFRDGTALLVDAPDESTARRQALALAIPGSKIRNVENLDGK